MGIIDCDLLLENLLWLFISFVTAVMFVAFALNGLVKPFLVLD